MLFHANIIPLTGTALIPHGTCYLWKPSLVGLHSVSNGAIALAYAAISLTLIQVFRKRPDLPFNWLLILFASFILFCGISHAIDIWTLWHPDYWFAGGILALTAWFSLGTATAAIALFPQVIAFPSPQQMAEKNRQLQKVNGELQKERQFLQALLESLSDGIVACDAEGVLTLFNQATQTWHGLPQKTITAEEWSQYYNLYRTDGKTPLPKEEIPLFRAFQGEIVRDEQIAIVTKEGEARIVLANGTPILLPTGEKIGAVVAIRDITERKKAEAALKESEERWQLVLEGTGDGIFDWNIITGEAFISPQFKANLGYRDEEMENTYEGGESCVHPDDLEGVLKRIQDHFANQLPQYTAEYRMRCKDGTYKWILAKGIDRRDEAGNPLRMVGSLQDITRRKYTETALKESLERDRVIAENSSDLIATQTLDGIYLYISPACRSLLGYEPEQMVGRSLFEFLHPEDATALQKTQTLIHQLPERYTHSYRMRRHDGSYTWLETTHKISRYSTDENQQLIVSISRDITARKQAEVAIVTLNQELEQELDDRKSRFKNINRLYRSVLNNVREVIFQTDKTGRWTFLSPAWESITGFGIEESLNKPFIDCVYSEKDQQRIHTLFQDLILEKRPAWRYEFRSPTKHGNFRWLEIYMRLNLDGESKSHFGAYGTINDITERKQAEAILKARADELAKQQRQIELQNLQLQEASRLKSQFLATMSHELRTPMNAIMGFSQMLQTQQYGELTQRQQDMVSRIFNNSQNLLMMLNEVLDFSKLEAGGIEPKPESFDLGKFLHLTVEELRSLADNKQLSLRVNLDLPHPIITSDQNCLRRVLVNLVSNAIKFTNTGGIKVSAKEMDNEQIVISVEDTGIGIDTQDLGTIFQAFRQVDQTLTRQHSGTGLGLAITKSLVEMIDGTIHVESQVGEGSVFRVRLPKSATPP
ncbi:PAS domain S-box protein [Lusitaniella coriacea LEGE 07157]|uniref:histidine kinase n=1 Tax=Lusitaniella coriacea LEGE 07157 TaxID=945747 RepID=A0A8J7DLE4_9CYAN|nr:PAS domain-containing protein [Lusitaniella coriacea]MBE9114893.1 PAS domain S-box protein [Lusitaniella coriacea LEGE 07157]